MSLLELPSRRHCKMAICRCESFLIRCFLQDSLVLSHRASGQTPDMRYKHCGRTLTLPHTDRTFCVAVAGLAMVDIAKFVLLLVLVPQYMAQLPLPLAGARPLRIVAAA
jgi:hypothetical protein